MPAVAAPGTPPPGVPIAPGTPPPGVPAVAAPATPPPGVPIAPATPAPGTPALRTPLSEGPLASPGDVIAGRYEIVRRIGAGGMGEVYEARHAGLGQAVALKLARADGERADDLRQRFLQEAKLSARLRGESLARVFDGGEEPSGLLFMAMEYIEGESLRALLKREHSLLPERARVLVRGLLAALGTLHAQGVLHRDVKPENVLLRKGPRGDEQIALLDFGIARPLEESAAPAAKGVLGSGTAGYAAPEQAAARGEDVRADLYSAAVILYEMLYGRRPFQAATEMAELTQQQTSSPAAPTAALLPAGLKVVLLRALSPEPADRFSTAEELALAIDQELGAALPPPPGPLARAGTRLDTLYAPLAKRSFWQEVKLGGWRDPRRLASLAALALPVLFVLYLLFSWMLSPAVAPLAAQTAVAQATRPAQSLAVTSTQAASASAPGASASLHALFDAGEYPETFEAIRALPVEDRANGDVQRLLALSAAEFGKWREVRPAFRAAQAANSLTPDDTPRLLRLASIALDSPAAAEARAFLAYELAAVETLQSASKDADSRRRQQAVLGLLELDAPGLDPIPAWLDALSAARDCSERYPLVAALLKRKDERSLPALVALRDDAATRRSPNRCLSSLFSRSSF